MPSPTLTCLPGSEVIARGLHWTEVFPQPSGPQARCRIRVASGSTPGGEIDLLQRFEPIEPVHHELLPGRAARPCCLARYRASLLDQPLGPGALLAVQSGRLLVEPYQLVSLTCALRKSRNRLLLADGVVPGKTIQASLALIEVFAGAPAHRVIPGAPARRPLNQRREALLQRYGLHVKQVSRAGFQKEIVSVLVSADAVVVAYGVDHARYGVCSGFSHQCYPAAPDLCLEKFGKLKQIDLDAFARKYDRNCAIPLDENFPQPAVGLPTVPVEVTLGQDRRPAIQQGPRARLRLCVAGPEEGSSKICGEHTSPAHHRGDRALDHQHRIQCRSGRPDRTTSQASIIGACLASLRESVGSPPSKSRKRSFRGHAEGERTPPKLCST